MSKKLYKVTQNQLQTLQNGGTITVGGVSYTYETGSDVAYIIVDPSTPEYRLSWSSSSEELQLTKDGTTVSYTTVPYADRTGYATYAHTVVYPSTNSPDYTFNLGDGGTINGTTSFNNSINVNGYIKLGYETTAYDGRLIGWGTSSPSTSNYDSILHLNKGDNKLEFGPYMYLKYTYDSSTDKYSISEPAFYNPSKIVFSDSSYSYSNLESALNAKADTANLGDQVTYSYANGVLTITSKS